MRTLASLLKAGYSPRNGSYFYRKNDEDPYIYFCRFDYGYKRKPITKPYDRVFDPKVLYIHPYFPDQPIQLVEIIKSFPYGKRYHKHALVDGVLKLAENIWFTEEQIYLYPTFFRPIYWGYT
ncbi:hypothetical protein [Flexithrix dorotheae]|uniref:hypothetical protein n=1 Tax=Flexithrix dorotheae TaxID=70993 RepID=UPI000362D06E|nr:hypothetical protein [Flexithrix dorotheae]